MKPDNHRPKPQRRVYPDELKKEAVQMLLDGHSAPSVRWTPFFGQKMALP